MDHNLLGWVKMPKQNLSYVLPQAMVRSRTDLHLIKLTPALRGRLVFAWRAGGPMSPAARELVNMARRLLAVGGAE